MDPSHYQAYLIRLWREDEDAAWRIVVTHVATGERHHFPSLGDLFAFLQSRQKGIPPARQGDEEISYMETTDMSPL